MDLLSGGQDGGFGSVSGESTEIQNSSRKPTGSPNEARGAETTEVNEAAKVELEHRVALYQFYLNSYIRGIAFFLAINAVLFKFAIDDQLHRRMFSILALLCGLAILIPLVFSIRHVREMGSDFKRLAEATRTKPIRVAPLTMLSGATTLFWLIIVGAWVYMLSTT